jgi:hypothetical protein
MGVLEGTICKRIEHYISIENAIKEAVKEVRDNQLYGSRKPDMSGGGGHAFISDSTAIRGVLLADRIKCITVMLGKQEEAILKPEEWLGVIGGTYNHFAGSSIPDFMQRRYKDNQDWKQTCAELYIERDTYYKWRDNVVTYAALLAVQHGLIRVR